MLCAKCMEREVTVHFTTVDGETVTKRPEDLQEDFANGFDFDEAFPGGNRRIAFGKGIEIPRLRNYLRQAD
jgi:hypothetical protein